MWHSISLTAIYKTIIEMNIIIEFYLLLYRLFGFVQFSFNQSIIRQIGAILIHVPIISTFLFLLGRTFMEFDNMLYPGISYLIKSSDFICLCASALAMTSRSVFYFINRNRIKALMLQVLKDVLLKSFALDFCFICPTPLGLFCIIA